jgi:hypothetical protein
MACFPTRGVPERDVIVAVGNDVEYGDPNRIGGRGTYSVFKPTAGPQVLALAAGTGLWIAYGFMRSDAVIVAANGISFALAGMLFLFKVRGLPGEARKDR